MIAKRKFQLEESMFSEEGLSSVVKKKYFHGGCLVILRVELWISAGPIWHWNCFVLRHWPFKYKGTLEWSQYRRTVFQVFLKESPPAKATALFPVSHWWILIQLEAFCLLLFFYALS